MQMRCKGAWHQRRGRNREMERRRHQRMSNAKFIPSNFSPFSQRANSSPSTRDEISRNSAGHLKLIYSYSFVNSKMNFDPTKPQLNSRAWVMPDFLWLMPVGLCFIVVDVYRHREFTILQKKRQSTHNAQHRPIHVCQSPTLHPQMFPPRPKDIQFAAIKKKKKINSHLRSWNKTMLTLKNIYVWTVADSISGNW